MIFSSFSPLVVLFFKRSDFFLSVFFKALFQAEMKRIFSIILHFFALVKRIWANSPFFAFFAFLRFIRYGLRLSDAAKYGVTKRYKKTAPTLGGSFSMTNIFRG